MRVRLTDGTREVEIRAPSSTPLPTLEDTARRLLTALGDTDPDTEQPRTFGFGSLDGVALDSTTERAELPDERELGDQDEDEQT